MASLESWVEWDLVFPGDDLVLSLENFHRAWRKSPQLLVLHLFFNTLSTIESKLHVALSRARSFFCTVWGTNRHGPLRCRHRTDRRSPRPSTERPYASPGFKLRRRTSSRGTLCPSGCRLWLWVLSHRLIRFVLHTLFFFHSSMRTTYFPCAVRCTDTQQTTELALELICMICRRLLVTDSPIDFPAVHDVF
jgi:hypothetical protein